MLPQDKAQVGAFSDKIEFSGTFTNDRDDLIGALNDLQFGNPTRALRRHRRRAWRRSRPRSTGRKVVLIFTDGDDTASRLGFGEVLERARDEGGDDLRHRAAVGVLQRPARAALAARSRPAQAGGGNRRRLLRAEKDRRARADVHARRAGAAQPLHARLHARGARRQGAQARGAHEAAGHDGARPHAATSPRADDDADAARP